MMKWLNARLDRDPCCILNVWFYFVLPVFLVSNYLAEDWFSIVAVLAIAALMIPLRRFVRLSHAARMRSIEAINDTNERLEGMTDVYAVMTEDDFHDLVRNRQVRIKGLNSRLINLRLAPMAVDAMRKSIDSINGRAGDETNVLSP